MLCSWDGSTFFFNRDGQAAHFLLCEEVTAFAVGEYGSAKAPSLIYACMGQGIRVYSDIEIPSIAYVWTSRYRVDLISTFDLVQLTQITTHTLNFLPIL